MSDFPCVCPDCEPLTIQQCDGATLATGFPGALVKATKGNGIQVIGTADVAGSIAIPSGFTDADHFFTQYSGTIRIEVIPDLQQDAAACWNVTMTL